MNGTIKTALTFGIDELEVGQFMAYGKLPGIPTDAVFTVVSKEKNAVEVIFRLSNVVVDAEKSLEVSAKATAQVVPSPSPESISKFRVLLLIEFLNTFVKKVLLAEDGATRLVLSLAQAKGFNDDSFREIEQGVKSADQVVLNMRSRELILTCQ